MGIKLTEQDLKTILEKNPKIKVSSEFGGNQNDKIYLEKNKVKNPKIKVNDTVEIKRKTKSTVQNINLNNREANFVYSYGEDYFSFIVFGGRLLSVNQIFAALQSRPFDVFNYKKTWHKIVEKIIDKARDESIKKGVALPYFTNNVEITIYRVAKRLVDADAVTTMFKFIIDAMKTKKNEKDEIIFNGILSDDNPKIVENIIFHDEKGDYSIGVRIQKVNKEKKKINIEDLLIS